MQELIELSRKVANLIRLGTVVEVYYATARCRVASGGVLTAFLPWVSVRAGSTREWNPPTVGEQVILLAPSGELAGAIVLTGLYSTSNAAPSTSPDVHHVSYPDGAEIEYDHATHVYRITLPADARIEITAPGDVHVNGDVIADGISLKNHVHSGVVAGAANTGVPA